jgi:hypothetical protein
VRLPKALYTSLQGAAKADHRTLADWLRLNLPRLLEHGVTYAEYADLEAERDALKSAVVMLKLQMRAVEVQEPTEPKP